MLLEQQCKELMEFEKGKIVALSKLYLQRKIEHQLNISQQMISTFLAHYQDCETINNLPHPDALGKMTTTIDGYHIHLAESETHQLLTQLVVQTNCEVSEQTIHGGLLKSGNQKWKMISQPLLTKKHAAQWLQWAKEHGNWTWEQ